MKYLVKVLLLSLFPLASFVQASDIQKSSSPEGASLYIISPSHGETVSRTFVVKFGLKGMGISPAGMDKKGTGHHHLIVDGEKLPDLDRPMGSDVMHFGGGQTQKTIELSEGRHTLQLILGNYLHVPHNPPVISEKITIFVK